MSNEWFERGVQDAQNDQLNMTHYQHYYYYKLGYDHARRQMRRPALAGSGPVSLRGFALIVLLLVVAAGYYVWQWPRALPVAAPSVAAPTVLPTVQPSATSEPTAVPTPAPLLLQPEGFAQIVNTSGAPLRARAEPSRGSRVLARIPEGSRVKLLEGPIETEGYLWWRVEGEAGSGWIAQGEPGGPVWLEPVP